MTRLRWSSPPKEADPARVQRDSSAVIIGSDSDEAVKRRRKKRKAKKKAADVGVQAPSPPHVQRGPTLASLLKEQAKLKARIAALSVRSKKSAGLWLIPHENVLALRELRPREAELDTQIAALRPTRPRKRDA